MDLAPRLAANGTTTKPEENDEYGGVEEEEEEEEEEGGEAGEEGDEVEGEEGGGGKAAKGGSAVAMVWSGRVFALHDVYVNNKGQVFNATHVFNPNGCYAEDKVRVGARGREEGERDEKFHYEAGTRVSSYNSLVNLLVIGGTPGARVPFHEVLELVPLFLPLSRVLKKHGKPALVMRGKKLPRVVGITMGRMLSFGDAARLLFVRTLIQVHPHATPASTCAHGPLTHPNVSSLISHPSSPLSPPSRPPPQFSSLLTSQKRRQSNLLPFPTLVCLPTFHHSRILDPPSTTPAFLTHLPALPAPQPLPVDQTPTSEVPTTNVLYKTLPLPEPPAPPPLDQIPSSHFLQQPLGPSSSPVFCTPRPPRPQPTCQHRQHPHSAPPTFLKPLSPCSFPYPCPPCAVQPTFQHCQHPSPSLWSKLRSSHFLQPRGLPLLNPDWSERLPPSSPKTRSPPAAIPPWETSGVKEVIVLEPPAAVQVKGFAGIVAGLKGRFGAEHVRLVGRFQRDDARDLFPRAALLVSVTSPFLVNLAFLPPRAALLELRPPPAEVDAVIADSVASLAAACQIHHRVIRGSFVEGAAGGGRGKGAEEGAGKDVVEWRSGAVEAAAMFLARVVGKALTADEKVVEEAVLTAADRRMRAAQLAQASTSKQPLIPGTQIQSLQSAARFRRWLRCVSQRGRWAYNATPRILPWEYLGTMNLCDHRHQETTGGLVTKKADKYVMEGGASGGWSVRESLKYEWRTPPGKCPIGPLRQFDGDTFCRKAEGRKGGLNLVFLGDSLAHQMVVSFLNGLLRHIPKPAVCAVNETIPQECSDWLVEPPRHAYCRVYTFNESVCPGLKVQFVRNDHLWFTSPGEAKFDHIPWHLYSGLNDAHVVVVNRGAHFIGGKDFERSVPAALSFLRKKLPDALIIWRNTPPGHANCTTYIGPIKKRQNPEILPFHWDMFTRQNKLVRGMMHEVGAVYMDVDTATALRPDSHKGFVEERGILDCLHYCTPGPTDMWVELLADIILRGVYGDGLAPLGVT
ncbi:unnamed protein product [Closterium sp. Naga37s-1]|nr:unnamed protein product [Closterium sp. Naga37s-1]